MCIREHQHQSLDLWRQQLRSQHLCALLRIFYIGFAEEQTLWRPLITVIAIIYNVVLAR
jgi:hypothetical protein